MFADEVWLEELAQDGTLLAEAYSGATVIATVRVVLQAKRLQNSGHSDVMGGVQQEFVSYVAYVRPAEASDFRSAAALQVGSTIYPITRASQAMPGAPLRFELTEPR